MKDDGWRGLAAAELAAPVGECRIVEVDVESGERYLPRIAAPAVSFVSEMCWSSLGHAGSVVTL